MKVSDAAFYAWGQGENLPVEPEKSELAAAVKEVFYLHRRRYGARRISAELKAGGLAVGRRLAGSLMETPGLEATLSAEFRIAKVASAKSLGRRK